MCRIESPVTGESKGIRPSGAARSGGRPRGRDAAGDLLVNYFPSALDQTATLSKVLPVDGGSAFTLQGPHNAFAISGEAGEGDENGFYVTSGGGGGWPFDQTLRFVTKSGSAFVETLQTVTVANASSFGFLFRLGDGIYMFSKSEKALLRVVAGGALVANPTPAVLAGVDHLLDVGGLGIHAAAGQALFLASTGTGYKFIRYDGVSPQQDIPLEADIELSRVTFSTTGTIEFLGVRTGTQEKVRGTVAAGATEVTVSPAGVLDPAQVVVFTRIN
jgi:hypothetical protein